MMMFRGVCPQRSHSSRSGIRLHTSLLSARQSPQSALELASQLLNVLYKLSRPLIKTSPRVFTSAPSECDAASSNPLLHDKFSRSVGLAALFALFVFVHLREDCEKEVIVGC